MTGPDPAAELAVLRHRLDALESREEIRRLRHDFHDHVGTDRWTELGELFAADAELDYAYLGSASGREAIGAFFSSVPERMSDTGEPPFVKQFVHAHSVDVDGDSGTGSCHLFATAIHRGESYVVAGRFTDTYRRVDGRWLFASVRLEPWYTVPLTEGWSAADRHRMSLGPRH